MAKLWDFFSTGSNAPAVLEELAISHSLLHFIGPSEDELAGV